MERYRFILAAILIIGLISLAIMIALGKVEEKTSFGLTAVLLLIQPIAQSLAAWAFDKTKPDKPAQLDEPLKGQRDENHT